MPTVVVIMRVGALKRGLPHGTLFIPEDEDFGAFDESYMDRLFESVVVAADHAERRHNEGVVPDAPATGV